MEKKRDFILSILIIVLFMASVTFLYFSFTSVKQSNTFLILALVSTILGNLINIINNILKKKNKDNKKENK